MPHAPPGRHVPSSAVSAFIDRSRLDRALSPWVPDAADRAFVVRCLVDEGPAHHRGANYVLLSLLAELAGAAPADIANQPSVPVPMRLPPGAAHAGSEQGSFPIRLPTALLERLAPAGSVAQDAMIDCLTDGPPQHALANVATVCLLSALLRPGEPGK